MSNFVFVTGIDFLSVALHEVGHALGLDHSTVRGSVMYPTYDGCINNPPSLTADDIAGIRAIYGGNLKFENVAITE